MSINDGGLAFPVLECSQNVASGETVIFQSFGGMTLRDYFAAKAAQGMLAEDAENYTFANLAKAAYETADALLAARGGTNDQKLAEAERDAARYRVLRDPNTAESSIWKLLTPEAQATPRSLLHGDALDAAVDKLRGVTPP